MPGKHMAKHEWLCMETERCISWKNCTLAASNRGKEASNKTVRMVGNKRADGNRGKTGCRTLRRKQL